MVTITCYDGVGVIGGSKILLQDGNSKIWLDFGTDFKRMSEYYEEFIQPKSCMGLYEPIQIGLLPPVQDLYREDLISPLANPWEGIEARSIGDIDGVLISHAHMDHLGMLHYVRGDIPIYSSAMTIAIAKAFQDTGTGGQYCYTCGYEPIESGELKMSDYRLFPSKSRPFILVGEEPGSRLNEFWSSTPSNDTERGRKHESIPLSTSNACGEFIVRRFPVDHSVPGASAWAVETSAGWIVYTGDLRCHGSQAYLTWAFAEETAKLNPSALIIEGTRIKSESSSTEEEVLGRALAEVSGTAGLVVADFGPRNIERLSSFLTVAKQTRRRLVILPKDAYLLESMASVGDTMVPPIGDENIAIYREYEASALNWRKALYERYPQDKFVTPRDVHRAQQEYICCFSYYDVSELAYIKPGPGSRWLYSSCEPFSEEMGFDFQRLQNWTNLFGIEFLGGTDPEGGPLHVSGHACGPHLLELIRIIRPRTVIPVHTESPHLFPDLLRGVCEVIVPERGVPIAL